MHVNLLRRGHVAMGCVLSTIARLLRSVIAVRRCRRVDYQAVAGPGLSLRFTKMHVAALQSGQTVGFMVLNSLLASFFSFFF